jgi:hypothetical protein
MEKKLPWARAEAIAGNKSMIDLFIQEVTEDARSPSLLDSAFDARVSKIKKSLGAARKTITDIAGNSSGWIFGYNRQPTMQEVPVH